MKDLMFFDAACGVGDTITGPRPGVAALLAEMGSFDGPAILEYEIPADVEQGFSVSLDFLRKEESRLAR